MMRLSCLTFLVLMLQLAAQTCLGAVWYIDRSATAGSNNGTSWANAWTDPVAGMGSTLIQPGDTIYISGGVYGDYGSKFLRLATAVDGTSNAPITFKVSQEPGHNSPVIIYGRFSIGNSWWQFSGAKDDGYVTNIVSTADTLKVTNNINLTVLSSNSPAFNYFADNCFQGASIKWVEAANFDFDTARCVQVNVRSNCFNCEIAYNYFHDSGDTLIFFNNGNPNPSPDNVLIHHNYLRNSRDDGVYGFGGLTIYNNIMWNDEGLTNYHGHPDAFQTIGAHIRVFNNWVKDYLNSCGRFARFNVGRNPFWGDIQYYGNLVENTGKYSNLTDNMCIFVSDFGYEPGGGANWWTNTMDTVTWTNIVVANNTFINGRNGTLAFTSQGATIPGTTNFVYYVTNTILKNCRIQNNLIWNSTNGAVSLKGTNGGPTHLAHFFYTTNDLVFENNCVAATSSANSSDIIYQDVDWPIGEALNAGVGFRYNNSMLPTFANPGTLDGKLASNDFAARNKGADLTGLGLPGITIDLYGTIRGNGGPWDIGACENAGTVTISSAPTNGLIAWFSFEDDFADAQKVTDFSNSGHDAWRFGKPNLYKGNANPTPGTNWPSRVTVSSSPGRPTDTGYAGNFHWYPTSEYGLYNKEGQYAGIATNTAAFTNMNRATFAVWARYYSATNIDPTFDFPQDQNATLLSGGTAGGQLGSWEFGRNYDPITYFYVCDGAFSHQDKRVKFPDAAYNTKGDTAQWNHYAITWNNGNISAYFNGVLFTNITITNLSVTNLTLGYLPQSANWRWLGIGCMTHAGTPPMESPESGGTDYPNHGWFNGVMDDVRIYNRDLSSNEIYSIYSGSTKAALPPPQNLRITQ